jgi:hypothetical protein
MLKNQRKDAYNSLRLGEPNPCAFPLAKRGSLKEGGFKYPAIGFSTLPRS